MNLIITVQVTPAHIDKGEKCDSMRCPIAHALRERMPKSRITVGSEMVAIDGVLYELPETGRSFVRNFDSRCKMSPFSLSLQPL